MGRVVPTDDPHRAEGPVEPVPSEIQLAAELDDAQKALAEARKDRDAWRDAHLPDREAQALSQCVKALDPLTQRSFLGSQPDTDRTRRILRYLADRYGVTWYDPPAAIAIAGDFIRPTPQPPSTS